MGGCAGVAFTSADNRHGVSADDSGVGSRNVTALIWLGLRQGLEGWAWVEGRGMKVAGAAARELCGSDWMALAAAEEIPAASPPPPPEVPIRRSFLPCGGRLYWAGSGGVAYS